MRAISTLSLEAGTSTFWCRALIALRMRANISATGSVNLIVLLLLSSPFASLHHEEPAAASIFHCIVPIGLAMSHDLPRRFRNARNFSTQGQPAETKAANTKLAKISARTSADLAAVMLARRKLGLLCVFNSFCCSSHLAPSFEPSAFAFQLSAT